MKKYVLKLAPIITILIAISAALVPVFKAEDLGATVRISTTPDGPFFIVDGQSYQHAMSAVWPVGSKHVLTLPSANQQFFANKTQYSFTGWQVGGATYGSGPTITITADPNVTNVTAVFTVQYALSLVFFSCPDGNNCQSPGTIYVGGSPYTYDQDIYEGAGGKIVLMAAPNSGYVFTSWQGGANQVVTGPIDTVTMNAPVLVYPHFQVARRINLATNPPNLQVLADRAPVPTPSTVEWGWESTHTVGPVSPQEDLQSKWWVFSSWSDGGAPTHAYTVARLSTPDTLTANYVPASPVLFVTSPAGLTLKIDGRDNWLQYLFTWGTGETHHIEAPAQQTDAQNRIWAFQSWSDGGAAAHDFTVPASAAGVGVRLTATYTPVAHLVITSAVAGLSVKVDGNDCGTPCDVQRPVGTTVRLSAPASVPQGTGARADFSGWPGSGSLATDFSLTLGPDPVTLSANYHMMNQLAATARPPQGASWTIQPSSPDGFYDPQTTVAVAVSAQPGYRFRTWNGDLSGTKPYGAVSMNTPRSVEADMDPIPYIAPAGIGNAAGATPQTGVAAGSVVSITGENLAGAMVQGPASPLAQTLGGVTVRLGDRVLPLLYVSPQQINLQLPDDVVAGPYTLTVSSQGQPDVQSAFTVVRNAPGLFQQTSGGISIVMAVHEDGSAVTADSPAKSGELLTVYGTGFGPADHSRPEGFALPDTPDYLVVDTAGVSLGDASIVPEKVFSVAGRVGVDAVQFRFGDGVPSGTNAPLHVTINGQDSNIVPLPVQ